MSMGSTLEQYGLFPRAVQPEPQDLSIGPLPSLKYLTSSSHGVRIYLSTRPVLVKGRVCRFLVKYEDHGPGAGELISASAYLLIPELAGCCPDSDTGVLEAFEKGCFVLVFSYAKHSFGSLHTAVLHRLLTAELLAEPFVNSKGAARMTVLKKGSLIGG